MDPPLNLIFSPPTSRDMVALPLPSTRVMSRMLHLHKGVEPSPLPTALPSSVHNKKGCGASLMVQWLRLHCMGPGFNPWSGN